MKAQSLHVLKNVPLLFLIPIVTCLFAILILLSTVVFNFGGVQVETDALEMGITLGVVTDANLRVVDIEAGSTAASSGIHRGDVLVALNNNPLRSAKNGKIVVNNTFNVYTRSRNDSANLKSTIVLYRNGQQLILSLQLKPRLTLPGPTPTGVPTNQEYF